MLRGEGKAEINWEVKVIQKHQYQQDTSLLEFREGSIACRSLLEGKVQRGGRAWSGVEEIVGFKEEKTAMWVRCELASVFSEACGHPHTL